MRSEKGITLISVIIYVIVMVIVVSVMSVVSTYFYKNISGSLDDINPLTEFTTFNTYFSEETNYDNIKVLECATEENGNSYIVFDNGVQYTFVKANKGIYRNKVKICKNIDNCTFSETIQNGKNVVVVEFKSGTKQETMNFTLDI